MVKVQLTSQEGQVEDDVAQKSNLIKSIIEDTGTDEAIPLPNVKIETLKRVMNYCTKHKNDVPAEIEKPLKTNDLKDVVEPWDADFINLENLEDLFDIILAANYLDIKSLLELSCAKVATLIKGKTAEEIRKTFNIVNDLTPEEEAQIREENKWADEAN